MGQRPNDEDPIAAAAGIVLIAGYLLWTEGPISWFLAGTVAAAFVSHFMARRFNQAKERAPTITVRLMARVASDARNLFINLAIGFGLVLLLQVWFHIFGTGRDASSYGTWEQRLWEFLRNIDAVTSPFLLLAIVFGIFIVSSLIGVWWPMALARKVRKAVSAVGAVLGAALMFSFVAPAAADRNYTQATAGIRAQLISDLTQVAATRRSAAAYQWAAVTLAEDRQDRAWANALAEFLSEGAATCTVYNDFMDERTRRALRGYRGQDPPGSRGFADRLSIRRAAEAGEVPVATLRSYYPHCDKNRLAQDMGKRLVERQIDSDLGADMAAMNAVAAGEMPPDLRPWIPEFASIVAPGRESSPPQRVWRAYFQRREIAANEANAAEGTMRSALAGAISHYVDADLGLPIEPIVEAFRDAAVAMMIEESVGRVRQRVSLLRRSGRTTEPDHRPLLANSFPKSAFGRDGVRRDSNRRAMVQAAFEAVVPEAAAFVEAARAGPDEHRNLIRTTVQARIDRQRARLERDARARAAMHRLFDEIRSRIRPRIRGR